MITAERLALERERLQRVPGIYFGNESDGRRAKIAGTGIDVWEIVRDWLAWGRDFEELCRNKEWLSPTQLSAALDYYALYPDEIERHIRRDAETGEILAKYAPVVPPWPRALVDEFKALGLWADMP